MEAVRAEMTKETREHRIRVHTYAYACTYTHTYTHIRTLTLTSIHANISGILVSSCRCINCVCKRMLKGLWCVHMRAKHTRTLSTTSWASECVRKCSVLRDMLLGIYRQIRASESGLKCRCSMMLVCVCVCVCGHAWLSNMSLRSLSILRCGARHLKNSTSQICIQFLKDS
jgi:hypothetical protein